MRRRLIAVAIVSAAWGTALALQLWPQATTPQSNPSIPIGSNGRVVFSLRNTTSTMPVSVSFGSGSGSDCLTVSAPLPLDPNVPPPYTLAFNQQLQFVVDTTGFATGGTRQCYFPIITMPPQASPPAGVAFHVDLLADVDVQPTSMSFGTQPKANSEVQTIAITSWGVAASVEVEIINDTLQHFELSGSGCGSTTLCTIALPGGGGFGSAQVHCNAVNAGSSDATATVYAGSTVYGSVQLICNAAPSVSTLFIQPDPLALFAPSGGSSVDSVMVMASGSATITTASIVGGNGTMTIQECNSASCTFGVPRPLTTTLNIVCRPTSMMDNATLFVDGPNGNASSSLSCSLTGGPGVLFVSPGTIPFSPTQVFGEASATVTIRNTGSSDLSVSLALNGTDGAQFAFSACGATTPCTVAPSVPVSVTVYFRPQSHGDKLTQLGVTAVGTGSGSGSGSGSNTAIQTATVDLSGRGVGGVMVVTQPPASSQPPYHLDLGTLPLDQNGSAAITVRNDGNAVIAATITGASSPYTLTPATDDVSAGSSTSYVVTCGSNAPSANNDQTWTVSSNAYTGSPQTITVSCAIADTNVEIDPTMFDFDEVRTGTAAQSRTLTVSNPGPGSASIASMQLRSPRVGLSLMPAMTTTVLAPNTSVMATLTLQTAADSDLTGEFIDIEVGSATLNLPVRGRVVTARSRISPDKLELGTACVGSLISGQVRLANEGTATLGVERPEMDDGASFLASTPTTMFPAALPPGQDLVADVAPTGMTTGSATGMLTWRDDVPNMYQIPITLEYVSTGTAVSPRGLDFGAVAVDDPPFPQRVTLENCDLAPTTVRVKSLRGIKGPIGAWILEPRVGFSKPLASHEKQAILISFKPPARGRYEAELILETAGVEQKVLLAGDASGRDFDRTSFYACACTTHSAPWRGWPIVLAIIVVSVRRRRGSSSSR